ncbi:MAG: methyl-accepting chemotaxis protein [Lachnospiraceae bacterium]|nr:methyl-accepting chemotaxis protein [Lachnospiraceae bacterium]
MAREKKEKPAKAVRPPKNGGVGINAEALKNMKVQDKFSHVFNRLLVFMLIASASLIFTVLYCIVQYHTMYSKYYTTTEHVADGRAGMQSLSKNILYIMVVDDPGIIQQRMDAATSDSEQLSGAIAALDAIYPDSAVVKEAHNIYTSVTEGAQHWITRVNEGAGNAELYEIFEREMLQGLTDLKDALINVEAAAHANAEKAYTQALAVAIVFLIVAVILVVLLFLTMQDAKGKLTYSIVEPVRQIVGAAEKMSEGHLEVDINYESGDELGELSDAMRHTTDVIHGIIEDLTGVMIRLGSGDLVHGSKNPEGYIGDFHPIFKELRAFRTTLLSTMGEIRTNSDQVAHGASNMAQGAQDLAEGSSDQAASVQELTASVASVMTQSETLAESADKGNRMAGQVKAQADTGIEKMEQVVEAMESITQSSNQIASIIQTIEDIASQTNLLSLNASIEAARAGEAGKGFAVVADEIRQLAAQSGEAAGHIREVIQTTVDSVNHGNAVVEETNEALGQVAQSIIDIQTIMQENSEEAANQKVAMEEINRGIEQISQVVQANSATAEESNAISEELSAQSQSLNALINKFSIDES